MIKTESTPHPVKVQASIQALHSLYIPYACMSSLVFSHCSEKICFYQSTFVKNMRIQYSPNIFLFLAFVCKCECICMFMCCKSTYVYLWKPENNFECHSSEATHLHYETKSLTEIGSCCRVLAGWAMSPGVHLSQFPQHWQCKYFYTQHFNWVLGIKLSSSCFHGKHTFITELSH